MTTGGDAAEQVVRLSLEGFEVAVRLSGSAAKNIAFMLAAALKQEQAGKTKGKARLTSMIKSGKELKVVSINNRDLTVFNKQAKQYGVLYCVLRDKHNKAEDAVVDIIVRAEDASKIERICERFNLGGKLEDCDVSVETEKEPEKETAEQKQLKEEETDKLMEEILGTSYQKQESDVENPTAALAEMDENNLSGQNSDAGIEPDNSTAKPLEDKPSVKEKLEECRHKVAEQKKAEQNEFEPVPESTNISEKNNKTVHEQPRKKKKNKNKFKKKHKNREKGR